jgi:hypothetical protein
MIVFLTLLASSLSYCTYQKDENMMRGNTPPSQQIYLTFPITFHFFSYSCAILFFLSHFRLKTDQVSLGVRADSEEAVRKFCVAPHGFACRPPNVNSEVFSKCSPHSTHGAEPFSRSRQLCSYSRTSQRFMEPESPLPCSQEPSAGPYPEPDQSNPSHIS